MKRHILFSFGRELFSAKAIKEIIEAELDCEIELFVDVTALEQAFGEAPLIDLVIYDSPLPAISASRSLRRLRQYAPDLPAILLATIPGLVNGNGKEYEFNEIIYKPVDWQDLLERILALTAEKPASLGG